ncbi:MAG: hypothetical protein QNJ57_12700 [Flavobacteriaceae bacterium]|nr:hypothetical protein [Flavobacteriaceae bacterium]
MRILFLVFIVPIFGQVYAQQSPKYFDFWKNGTWASEITIYNNDTIPEKDSFTVNKLEGKNAFSEQWTIFVGDGQYVNAEVLRAYDNETKTWKLFYVDDLNAQTWNSLVSDGQLFFHKTFTYNNKTFYSRQSWTLRPDGKVLRTIERSEDNKTWKPRYRQLFKHSK